MHSRTLPTATRPARFEAATLFWALTSVWLERATSPEAAEFDGVTTPVPRGSRGRHLGEGRQPSRSSSPPAVRREMRPQ